MAVQHPFVTFWDAIAALKIDGHAKAVLVALARHGHWETGENCAPSVARLAAETGFSERLVQYALRSLACDPHMPCMAADGRCKHYGLIIETKPATRRDPAVYRISGIVRATQPLLPEVGRVRAADPYAAVVKRSYGGALDPLVTLRGARGAG